MKKNNYSLLLIGCLILVTALILLQFSLPEPLPTDAPLDEFSALRATTLLAQFATEPHPTGSQRQAEVREVLISELEQLGLEVQTQSATGVLSVYGVAGDVENILARLPGTNPTGAILLMAHYDSVPQGPGAGDNGSGVVTILETLRALQVGPVLRNDLLVLFTDSEENGTLGAHAFVAEHAWMEEVSVVLNIEGSLRGKVVLVETGPENGWMVEQFAAFSPDPVGYSWLYDLFGMMPNLTDFMPFREAGVSGANLFAFNGGFQYHTALDTIENINLPSLQHHGSQTLALVQNLGQVDLGETQAPDATYFNLYMGLFVHYPAAWSLPIAVAALLAWLLMAYFRIRRGQASAGKILLGLLVYVTMFIVVCALVLAVWAGIRAVYPQYDLYFAGHMYNDAYYAVGLAALAAAAFAGLNNVVARRVPADDLYLGAMGVMAGLGAAMALLAPGFSYLFSWALIFGLAGYGFSMQGSDLKRIISLLAGGIPALLLWVPVGYILFQSTGMGYLVAIAAVVVFALGFWLPALEWVRKEKPYVLPVVCLIVAAVALVGGSLTSRFSREHPMPLRVQYVLDTEEQAAYWINPPQLLSTWQNQFLSEDTAPTSYGNVFPPFNSRVTIGEAALVELPAPLIELVEDEFDGEARHVVLETAPGRDGDMLLVSIAPGADLMAVSVNGHSFQTGGEDSWQTYHYVTPPQEGVRWTFSFASTGGIDLIIAERSVGLDAELFSLQPRPDDVMSIGDYVYSHFTLHLDPAQP